MATYAELQTRVLTRLIDTPTSVQTEVPTLVLEAIKLLQEKHNFKVMEAQTSTLTTTLNSTTLTSQPADFKEFRGQPYLVSYIGAPEADLDIEDYDSKVYRAFGNPAGTVPNYGDPKVLLTGAPTSEAGAVTWTVWPPSDGNSDYPDGEYRLIVPYWKFLTELSSDGSSNWFTVNAVEYIVNQATSEGFFLDWDEKRAAVWAQKAQMKYGDVIARDKRYRLSKLTTLVPHRGARGPRLGM